ncbi:MAG: sigma-54-dependent Fis family transcriptional regulator [Deltaproteobacteria bacterium]|nr:sigma-54-dependent Fis family transcriptional regulator [Deltaproteobacteria bacterium]
MNKKSEIIEKKRLLIIDDEENMRHMLTVMLKNFGYSVQTAADGAQGLQLMGETEFDFVLCDIKMPNMDGMTFLSEAGKREHETTIIMMSAYGSVETAIAAMKKGAYDYISKPFKADEVQMTLKKAEERERLKRENRLLRERISHIEENYRFRNMIGKSSAMKEVFKLVEKVAQYNTTVLISGESGTGKELIAKGIHLAGNRSEQNLVSVNCGGIQENLLESEFFGYKKGAFTGADRDKKGLFQEADKGTIFLDEIGELPLSLQVKLLRVLQESEIRPIGSTLSVQVDVRVIAATQKDLQDEVSKGRFREDLFYRLNVLSIHLPPLRDRLEDLPLLMDHFIGRFNKQLEKNIRCAAPAAIAYLLAYHWPGNIRELENVIERAVVLSDEDQILPELLPQALTDRSEPAFDEEMGRIFSLKHAKKILEKKMIVRALKETHGNRTRASKLLEISHPSLLSKMKTYEIDL